MDYNEDSRWRVEFAKELIDRFYSKSSGIEIAVLGGSPTKNLSDQYSDIDLIINWKEKIDTEWVENNPLKGSKGRRLGFRKMGDDIYLETHYFGNLKVDIGHTTMENWNLWCKDIFEDHNYNEYMLKSINGYLNAIPLIGEESYQNSCKKLKHLPKEVADKMVYKNLGFFVEGCIENQGLFRDDLLFFYFGLTSSLQKIMNILGGLNRAFFSAQEPRWIEYELENFAVKPEKCWERVLKIFKGSTKDACSELESLIVDVIELAESSGYDLTRLKKGRKDMEVKPCFEKPQL